MVAKNDDTTKFIHKQTLATIMRKGNARCEEGRKFRLKDRSFIRNFPATFPVEPTRQAALLVKRARLMRLFVAIVQILRLGGNFINLHDLTNSLVFPFASFR